MSVKNITAEKNCPKNLLKSLWFCFKIFAIKELTLKDFYCKSYEQTFSLLLTERFSLKHSALKNNRKTLRLVLFNNRPFSQ